MYKPDNKLKQLKGKLINDASFMRTVKSARIKRFMTIVLRKLGLK